MVNISLSYLGCTVNSLIFAGINFCGQGAISLIAGINFCGLRRLPIPFTWENVQNGCFAGINFCGILKTAKFAKINPAQNLVNLQ